jgi:CheY-like chemotaxis protein
LLFTVADTGCGMSPEIKEKIFEPFFTTKEVGKGTGLGLSMVYGLVHQHHGAIHVYSEPGFGTTFRIYLPTVDHAVAKADARSDKRSAGGTETILIAEDDPMVCDLAVRMLSRAGYQTIVASDGEEAVRLFVENVDRVSLVLLDVVMPRMGGREALDRIKLINPNVHAIFSSGYDPEMAQVGDVMVKELLLIQKPFDPEVLLGAIREILDTEPCHAAN